MGFQAAEKLLLKIGREALDRAEEIVGENGVEALADQKGFVSPVADDQLIVGTQAGSDLALHLPGVPPTRSPRSSGRWPGLCSTDRS